MARKQAPKQATTAAPAVQPVAAPAVLPQPPATTPVIASMLAQLQAHAAALQAAPVPTATPQPARVVAIRGGLAIAQVVVTGKPYRVTAPHNVQQWALVLQATQGGTQPAGVPALVAAGVPAPMVGYLVRRGYCAAA